MCVWLLRALVGGPSGLTRPIPDTTRGHAWQSAGNTVHCLHTAAHAPVRTATRVIRTWLASRLSAGWTTTVWTPMRAEMKNAGLCVGQAMPPVEERQYALQSVMRQAATVLLDWKETRMSPVQRLTAAQTKTVHQTRLATTAIASAPAAYKTHAKPQPSVQLLATKLTVPAHLALRGRRGRAAPRCRLAAGPTPNVQARLPASTGSVSTHALWLTLVEGTPSVKCLTRFLSELWSASASQAIRAMLPSSVPLWQPAHLAEG